MIQGQEPETQANEESLRKLLAKLAIYDNQISDYYRDIFVGIVFRKLEYSDIVSFSRACKQTYAWTNSERTKRTEIASLLIQAVVLGQQDTAKDILDNAPSILKSTVGRATDYCGKKFKGLTPFQAALLGDDIDMAEMMKPYFNSLENGQSNMESEVKAVFQDSIETYCKDHK